MSTKAYGYFDEAYFQDGEKRGTAYVNYKETARNSPTYREIALAVREVFQPRRTLEIGCATGAIVRNLNELGCESYGIDVSEWAVRNAEHRNVKLASADSLPFPDKYFDLVISCHSLEHMPDATFEGAMKEMTRVGSAFQFHMLPIVGEPPYEGDPGAVRQQLRKDPTHQQLHELQWWTGQFEKHGLVPVNACLLIKNDTATVELSTGQFVVRSAGVDDQDVLRRSKHRNQRVFREVQLMVKAQRTSQIGVRGVGSLSYAKRVWKDAEMKLGGSDTVNLEGMAFELVVIAEGGPCALRFAAGQDNGNKLYAHVGEIHVRAQPGCNLFRFTTDQLTTLRGSPDYSKINHLALGGENENAEIFFYLGDQNGNPVFLP